LKKAWIKGKISGSPVSFKVAGQAVPVGSDGAWAAEIPIQDVAQEVRLESTDGAGRVEIKIVKIQP
jgi:hypothetical protein